MSPNSVAEGANATNITVTATLVGSQRAAETAVTVSRTGGTATSGTDYAAISNFTVTIAAGASSGTATLSFDPTEDTLDEDNETVILTGSAPSGLSLTAGTAMLTITDNDDAPTAVSLAVSPNSALESAAATSITVTATLVGSQRTESTAVTVSQTGGTATSGTDYAAISDFTVTIAAGASSGTATLSFDPTEDTLDEDNETVILTGSAPSGLSLTAGTATLTITDNDDAPTAVSLAVSPNSALESAAATSITVTASLVGSQRTESTAVTVSRTGGTATSGTDYAAISDFTVTIAAGQTSGTATLSFDPTEDTLDEDNETVMLTARGPPSLSLAAGTATLTITDNDDAPTAVTLAVSPNSVAEGANATNITVTATLVGSQRTESTAVTVSRTGGTATSDTDYAAISDFTVTIAAGASSGTATLSFDPTEDTLDEDNETVVLTGSAPEALNLTAGTATLTITDNDDAPTAVSLAVSPNSALESAAATSITVTASLVGSQRTADTAVTVRRTGGTATSGTDYAAISNFTVTIAAGASSGTATLSFAPTDDTLDEADETVVLTGSGPSALSLAAGTATLTITDNDEAPTAVTLAVSPNSVAEGANATNITVTATLVGSQRTESTAVTVSRTGGTATSGTDYAAISNFTVTIAAGASSGTATLSFDPTEDTLDESDETVVLTGSGPSALSLTEGTATLTITDNDEAPTAVTLAVSPNSVAEGANATNITVTATLVGSQRIESTAVTVSRTGGTATSGTDYAAISNFTVTIAAGASSGTATLGFDPTEDTLDEENETVVLTGSGPSALSLTAGTATLTITDNDAAPTAVTLAVSPNSVAEGANATNITVTATLVGSQRTESTAVTVSRTGGTATSGADYAAISNFTVTIAAGASSGTATLSFAPTEDTLDESDETVVLTGSGPSALSLTEGTATLTITDNDDAPTAVTLAASPNSVAEGANATNITVTATLVGSQRTESTAVTVSRTGGTATSGTDYAAISNFTVTIAAGASSGTATLSFAPTDDTLDEADETVVLTGSAPSALSLTAGTATLTITDNDAAPTAVTLAVSPNSVAEGANATNITVTATLVGSQRTESTAVTVSRTGGTATSGTDYAAISNFTVTIAAGASSGTATLSFAPTEDTLDESDETVVLTGSGPSALSLTAGTATLTITDNDDAPTAVTLAVSPNSVAEGANATNITVTATLVGSQRIESTAVTVSRTGGTATSGTDYAAISNFTVTIAAGASSGTATLSFDPTEDTLDEDNETVVLTGSGPSALSLAAGTATLTITDNDDAPTAVSLTVSPNSALESAAATSITVTATLVGSQRTESTAVTVSRTGGTATSGTDYAAISNFTVTIAAGASSGTATLSFDPTEDTLDEDNETVVLTGSGPSALSLAVGTATLTITDNDAAPTAVTLAVSPNSVAEGATATNISVTASLVGSQRTAQTAVTVSRTGGTATSGTDYAAISDFTVTIAAGQTSGTATLSFDPTEDTLDEADETVVLTGSAPSALSLAAGTATLTITDNDAAPTAVTLAVNPNSVAEGANATNITVTASLVGSQRTAQTAVTVSRTGGTATSGRDYAAISDFTVTIAAGQTSGTATLSFDPTEDTLDEADETVVLTGSGPSALSLAVGTATLTIADNDAAPTAVTLAVNPNSVAEGANATNITVTASLVGSQRTAQTAVTVSRTGGTATSGADYAAISDFTVTIAAGQTSGTATLSFSPTEDTLDEADETVVLTGSGPSALSLTAGTATLTITDNDAAPTAVILAVSPNSVAEGASATNITVTASLNGSQRTESTAVTVTRTGGTATSGTDYAAISNFTVTIPAEQSSGTATLSFDPTDDTIDDDNETVVLTGAAPNALSLTAGTATLTITDNDAAPTAVTLAVSPNSVAEGAEATDITVTATLTGSQRSESTAVTVSRTGGTATSGTDYAAISNFTVTIAAGASSGTATLGFDPTEDTLDEENETVVLTGAAPSPLSLTAGTATLTITDNDAAPTAVTLAVSPNSVAEGANATSITVTASLTGSQRTESTAVTVSRTGGTATSGTDYAAISDFTVTIAAGASSGTATLSFDPTEDTLDEENETVVLTGAAPTTLSLTAGTATLTITDNDAAPTAVTLAVSPNSVAEGANATNITVTATLTGSQRTAETAVTVSRTGGTATSGTDYAAISDFTVTIAAGASSGTATLSFDPTDDTLDEENETVVLTGSAPTALSLAAGTATLTITDNDAAPTAVTLAVSPNSVAESANATSITVTATLTGSQRTESTAVTVSRTGGTATSGTDYAAISDFTVTIAAGASSGTATLSFDPTDDTLDEENETVVLTGAAPTTLSLTAGTATLTITDNDAAPTAVTLAVSPNSVAEGANATNITVTASLTGSQRTESTAVTVSQMGGTATSGTDYAAISNFTVTIAAGASNGSATLSFDPTEDTLDESDETVVLTGSTATALSLAAGTATLTITDNDAAPTAVTLAVSPTSVAEGANATSITVTASLTGSQRTESTAVTVSRTGGTAMSGTDYAAISNFTVTIPAGASSGTATLSFDPTEDTLDESDETVVLTGSAPTALSLTAGTATLTITDNDAAPTAVTLAVSPTSVAEGANATNITVTASLNGSQRTESTAVTVSRTGGTATSGTDYAAISDFTVTIAAGETSGTATLSFDPTEDTLDESDETVVLTGSAATALSLAAGTATLTITDNDAAPTAVTLAVSPTSVAEGANATSITVTASLTGSQRTESTAVTVSRTGGTATSGTDYAAISDFTVTIAAGASSGTATLSFDPTEDTLAEGDETVVLTGAAPTTLSLTAGTATLTITDNDAAPTAVTLAVSPTSVAEGANATNITVTASLTGSQRTESTAVTVSRTGGTATSGTDYAAISDFTVTIAAGASSGTATLSFDPTEDTLAEGDETVVLTGSAPTALGLTAGTATLTITDNDAAPTAVTLAVSPNSVAEGANATNITVTASLTGSQRTESTAVTVSRTGGTATSGTDYAAISDFTVTIAAGASSGTATLSFDPTEDTLAEGDETVVLTGSAPTALSLTAGTATLTITDNDAAPTAVNLAVSPTSVAEGANATNITVTASLNGSQRTESTAVTVRRTGGTATSGTDYAAISDFTVTIAAGASSGTATLSFDPTEDTLDESDETVVLTGSAPSALGLTAGTATLTITDNDAAPTAVTLAVSPNSVAEGANATSITVTASLTGSQRTESTAVTVSRTGGTATSGTDYAAISAFTVTIAAGASSGTATLSFDPTEDTLDEENETVVLTGSAPSALNLTAGTATLTITDNDAAPTAVTLAVSPTSVAEGANATSITVTASLTGSQRTAETAVTVSRTGGTATSGTDYAAISDFTVTIAAGASSGTATLSFDPTEDTLAEGDETVVLTGAAPTTLSLTAGTATLTITDNDAAPTAVTLAVSPNSVAEGANATNITVTASLNGSQRTESTAVTVSRTGGTATAGTDYAAISNFTVTIAAGETSGTATLSFDPTEDTLDEDNETVVLTGSAPPALSLTAGTATLTITDNDAAPTAVTLAVSPSSAAESASATSITVTASLTGSQRTADTAVTVSRTGGTATSGTDYAAISDFTVTIAAGASSGTATLSFDPTEDTLDEDNETVVLTGSGPSGLSLTAGTATLTITDNDDAPTAVTLAVSPNSVAEGANATSITVTASLTGSQRTESTAVTVSRTGGTATSGTDYAAISDFTVTIAAGASSGTATLSFDPTEDTLDEENETVVLTGSAPSALSLTAGTATLTITDNDAAPTAVTLEVSPNSALESASATSITVTASLNGSQRTESTVVTVSRTGGTATAGTDYATISDFTVTIAAGASSGTATLSFDPTEDMLDEGDETVVLTGSAPSALSLTAGTATLTITDNDAAPTAVTLAVSPSSAAESASATSITVTASLNGSQRTESTAVTVSRTGGTATSGTDYAAISNFTVTIAAGASSGTATLSFDPTEDTLDEADETVVLTGSAPAALNLTAGTATLTITDNDAAPTAVTLAVSPTSVAEDANATGITVTASLTGSQRTASTAVTVSRTGGTATSGTDYAAISNFTVTIAAGASSGTATLSFDPTEDTLDESDETVVLTGSAPSALNLTAGTATLTITDNDSAPTAVTLAVSPTSVAESASATNITVTASLNGSQRTESTAVTVSRTGGTATSGTDYAAISDFTVTIAAGASSGTATLSFDPTEDTLDESDETVVLTGSAPPALGLTAGTATLTITDTDAMPTGVTLSFPIAFVSEGAGTVEVNAVIEVAGGTRAQETPVRIAVVGGTAAQGEDYTAAIPAEPAIPAGQSRHEVPISIRVLEDSASEGDETIEMRVTLEVEGGTRLASTATLTITDNDGAVTLSVNPRQISEGAPPTEVTVTATADRPVESTLGITVSFEAQGTGPAVEFSLDPESVAITIPAGQDSGTARLMLSPVNDEIDTSDTRILVRGTADATEWSVRPATLLLADNEEAEGVPERGPPQVTLWTDRLDYRMDEQIRLYLDIDPHGDEREYTVFFYRESIETGQRQYLVPRRRSGGLRDEVVDQYGQERASWRASRLDRVEQQLVWSGRVPYPGLWHFVGELRSPGTTQVLKRAYAKFVVPAKGSMLLTQPGTERTVRTELRLTSDRVYHLGDRLRVADGATLTIEAGTLIKAFRQAAAIVVEPGGRIEVRGRREAPVVMTCSAPVGQRFAGCWGGLAVRGVGASSGELRYLRVEFGGGGTELAGASAALAFEGVGDGTVIEHVQAHASLGDGLAFRGGTAQCSHCVASDAQRDSVVWSEGWQGSAQHLYVQQGAQGASALRGRAGVEEPPSPGPEFRNATLLGGYNIGVLGGAPGKLRSIGPGIVLEGQAAIRARNVLATGFGGFAVDGWAASFSDGRSRIAGMLLSFRGYSQSTRVPGALEPWVQYTRANPDLIDVRHAANPDPRPRSGSAALKLGTAVAAPFDVRFARTEDYAGAFGKRNWLEEWTFFGPEEDFQLPAQDVSSQSGAGGFPEAPLAGAASDSGGPSGGSWP